MTGAPIILWRDITQGAVRLLMALAAFLVVVAADIVHGQDLRPAHAFLAHTGQDASGGFLPHRSPDTSNDPWAATRERSAARKRGGLKFLGIAIVSTALSFVLASLVYRLIRHRPRPLVWLTAVMAVVVAICSAAGPFVWGQWTVAGWTVGLYVAAPVTFCVLLFWISNGGTLRR